MAKNWFECTKTVAYYLWEYTEYENALDLWYTAEDIACFFEQGNILDVRMVENIKELDVDNEAYIWFIRNIAYRLHLYTNNPNELGNWFLVERLVSNPYWVQNLTDMAAMLSKDAVNTVGQVHSDIVRSFYRGQTF